MRQTQELNLTNDRVPEDIGREDLIRKILQITRGQASILPKPIASERTGQGNPHRKRASERIVVDCSATPFVPEDWSIHPVDQVRSAYRGRLELGPGAPGLRLADIKRAAKHSRNRELKETIEGQPVLPANVLDTLLERPWLIPKSWKGETIFFLGTVYRDPGGLSCVRYLDCDEAKVDWFCSYLDLIVRRQPDHGPRERLALGPEAL